MGYDVFMIDYRGFGKSSNALTPTSLTKDVEIGYKYLQNHYTESQITIYGYSLGSSLATWIGHQYNPKALILEAPFSSMLAMSYRHEPNIPKWIIRFILKYHLRTDLWMDKVTCPIRILHGVLDKIVPIEEAFILVNKHKETKDIQIKEFMNCDHDNISSHEGFTPTLTKWMQEIL